MDFGSAGHRRISCQSAFNRRSLNSAPWRAHAHTHVRCVCVHKRSYAKFVNGEQFEGSRRRRGGEGNFGPRGPTSPPPRLLVVALTPHPGQQTRTRRKFSPEPRPSSPPLLSSPLRLSYSHSLFLFLGRARGAPRALTTRLIRARVCVSQRVRVISRLERLQVREEAANV